MRAILRSLGLAAAVALMAVPVGSGLQTQSPDAFTNDIRPIMERSCWNCHGAEAQRSGLDLRTRDSALAGDDGGPVIVPGRA
jgi:hypothetical protein